MLGGSVQNDPPPADNPPAETPPGSSGTDPNPNPDNPNPDNPNPDPNADPNQNPQNPDPDNPQNPQPNPQEDRTAKAFAQMRVQNKQYSDMLKSIAGMLKVDTSNPDAMNQKLQDLIMNAEAKNQGVDPAFYKDVQQLKLENAQFKQNQMQQQAILGFQAVKTTFNLTNQELDAFADQLRNAGVNPFENPIDLVREYKIQNFDAITQKKIDEAIKAEQERALKAQNQGSNPNNKQGAGEGSPDKINTVSQLTEFFNSTQATK
jgi:hypothetical protein